MAKNIKGGNIIFDVVMGGVSKGLGSLAKIGLAATALTAAFKVVGEVVERVVGFIRESIEAMARQEKAEILLAQTLKTTGQYSDETYNYLRRAASEIQAASIYGDEKLLPVMASFARLGTLSAREIARATSLTADLASATGRDLGSAQRMVFYALQGNVGMLKRAGIALDEAILKSGDISKIMAEIESRVGGTAKAMADTWGGTLEQIRNWLGDIKEAFGKAFIADPEVRKTLNWLREAVRLLHEQVMKLSAEGSPAISNLGKAFGSILKIVLKVGRAITEIGKVTAVVAFPVIAPELAAVGVSWKEYYRSLLDIDEALDEISKGLEEYEKKQEKINQALAKYKAAVSVLKIATAENNAAQIEYWTSEVMKWGDEIVALGGVIPGTTKQIGVMGDEALEAADKIGEATTKIAEAEAEAWQFDPRVYTDAYETAWDGMMNHILTGPVSVRARFDAMFTEPIEEAVEATDEWAEAMARLRDEAMAAAGAIGAAAIKGEDMGDAIQESVAQLAGMAAGMMMPGIGSAVAPIVSALFSQILGSLFGGEEALAVNFQQNIEINIGRGEIAQREFWARVFSRYLKPAMRDTAMEPGYLGGRG